MLISALSSLTNRSFNRTFMELKYDTLSYRLTGIGGFNRTFMELK